VKDRVLVRYGMISEVARFAPATGVALERGGRVVIHTHRGVEIGTLLEGASPIANHINGNGHGAEEETELRVLRPATDDDEQTSATLKGECEREFDAWRGRIAKWDLQLELIDLEWTLDKSKLILYVLNDRGPECTKLALQAAAAGLGTVEVQPVGPDGPVVESQGGGCGSGHCGSGGESGGCCG
jgi:cell fate regulator YaaT (PSP1 superfamily)